MQARIRLFVHLAVTAALSAAAPSSTDAQSQAINDFYDLKERPHAMRTIRPGDGPPLGLSPGLSDGTQPTDPEQTSAAGDSRPEAANSDPALSATPVKPPPHWQVHEGERLTDAVARFAARAGYIFQPAPASVIWRIDHDAGIDGDFPAALQWLADGFEGARARPYFKLHANNVVRLEAR